VKKCLVALLALLSLLPAFAASNQAATKTLTLVVASQPSITTPSLPSAVVGVAYTTTLTATNGAAPYVWTVGTGLPSGLSLSTTGVLSGTVPASACTSSVCSFTALFTLTDSANNVVATILTIKVASAVSVTTTSLPQAFVGVSYTTTLTAGGGVAPYIWSATGLPSGITLSSSGVLSGTVSSTTCSTAQCSFAFTVTVTDSSGSLAKASVSSTIK
jgi:Putative Ig domain